MRTITKNTLKLFMAVFFVLTFAYSANAIMISEVSGNVILGPVTGTGTELDPIFIDEIINGPDFVDLYVTDLGTDDLGDGRSTWGRWFQKTVTNHTTSAWTSFEIELQYDRGVPSPDNDLLSFAQGRPTRPFDSSVYNNWDEIFLPKDYVNFYDGTVAIGDTVVFDFYVTAGTYAPFYIRQNPNAPVPVIPEPSTYILLGSGFAALAFYRRRKTRS